ncbi:MAG: radical SAM protein [Lachnospiraceae bacterium]|nr:radical SAM protein [Lachnospiraceae bacterium]
MKEEFDLQEYLAQGVEQVVKDALKATLRDPRESTFMIKFASASRKASKHREELEKAGEHIPSYLICSITSRCNLHCAGCYSRCNNATVDDAPVQQLTAEEWFKIFREADELGVSFVLLAGGEPLLRRDIIEKAGEMQNILFPILTNGTFMDEKYFDLFDRCRNLLPVMSIEGNEEVTDARRGKGIYNVLIKNMDKLHDRHLFFGASVTVTRENIKEVSSPEFLDSLKRRGCVAVIYVEYVPVSDESTELALTEEEQKYLSDEIMRLREEYPEIVFISFPGDEKESGGCVAAGRGFFHINSHGGAEPCPFSPYSDINVRDTSLREAMHSRLFEALRSSEILADDHIGGCVLHEKRDQVEALLRGEM